MSREIIIMSQIQGTFNVAGSGYRLFRNNCGSLPEPKAILKIAGIDPSRWGYILSKCPRITYGLSVGSADLVGLGPDGRFFSVEVKTEKGKTTPEQDAWLAMIVRLGGTGIVLRSAEEAAKFMQEYK
jgi:hypothetical protein